jgi:hypothetical protein
MRRLRIRELHLIALLTFFVVPSSSAKSNRELIAMVPPGAQIVAGIDAPPSQGQPDHLVLITHHNITDFQDLFALTGVDGSRMIREVIFVAIANDAGELNEHSLLASGHFDQAHIFKSASEGGATITDYRGIPVLVIQPFARERGSFNEIRWLAVIDSNLLVFGSIDTTRRELDRYLDRSPADSSLIYRLAHLREKDQTWCLLSPPDHSDEIQQILASLDPKLAEIVKSGVSLEFGIHYGREVEFEYEAAEELTAARRATLQLLMRSPAASQNNASLPPVLNIIGDDSAPRGVIRVSMRRYRAWLAEARRYSERSLLP